MTNPPPADWRVDQARTDALEAAILALCLEYGYSLSRFTVTEARPDAGDPHGAIPEVDITLAQLPASVRDRYRERKVGL